MVQHQFLWVPHQWLGEGTIRLSLVDEDLKFYTRWKVLGADASGVIECLQEIQVQGLTDVMTNHFRITPPVQGRFTIEMENESLGKVPGKGLISEGVVGWELQAPEQGFGGFELYELLPDGGYSMHAQYATADQLRTQIQGKVWVSTAPAQDAQKPEAAS